MHHSATINSLWRAESTSQNSSKYYSQHGQGRDGYILNSKASSTSYEDGSFGGMFKFSNSPRDKPSYFHGLVKYVSDGQGRDSYILQNRGGFHDNTGSNLQTRYMSNLRSYESPRTTKRITLITAKEAAIYKQQQIASLKLSQPRLVSQKHFNKRTPQLSHSPSQQSPSLSNSMHNTLDSPSQFSPEFQRSFFDQNYKYRYPEASGDFARNESIKTQMLPSISHARHKSNPIAYTQTSIIIE